MGCYFPLVPKNEVVALRPFHPSTLRQAQGIVFWRGCATATGVSNRFPYRF